MIIRGVIFRSTIRAGHASLAIVVTSHQENDAASQDEPVVFVVIRFGGSKWNGRENEDVMPTPATSSSCVENITLMRSNIRRICKIGNELEFTGSFEKPVQKVKTTNTAHDHNMKLDDVLDGPASSNTKQPHRNFSNWERFVVDYHLTSSNDASSNIRLVQGQKWDSTRLQVLQAKYYPQSERKNQQKKPRWNQQSLLQSKVNSSDEESSPKHHKSGLGKRQQGEVVADFLLLVLSTMHNKSENASSQASVIHDTHNQLVISEVSGKQQTVASLQEQFERYSFMERWVPLDSSFPTANCGGATDQDSLVAAAQTENNVVDVAGGAGHVSLALALRDVKSTVVDPRCTVGSLPGRDRKLLKKSKKKTFRTFRAWFGSRPEGIDSFFREGCKDYFTNTSADGKNDSQIIPVCSMHSEDELLANCTAIVALHPDEATGIIVETAVKHRIPFVVV